MFIFLFRRFASTVAILFLFLTSCSISNLLNLKEPAPLFSKELTLPNLADDFVAQNKSVYPSWKNKNTSNVISVLSDCSDENINLKTIHAMITNAIDKEILLEEKKMTFKNTNAYFRKISGQINDHHIEVVSLSFQFKKCTYLTSLSGLPAKISLDLKNWNTFNQNIEFKK